MSLFNHVGGLVPRKSIHDLSYSKLFTCDMGQLIPVQCDEMVPGDVFNMNNEVLVRFQPLVAPTLAEIHAYVHYFFVPYRLLWDDWEKFITGGEDGQFTASIPSYTSTDADATEGSLWDYFGFPLKAGLKVNAFPFRAYKFIWNEYYRDENLMSEIDVSDDSNCILPKNRCWEKDYFTSSLPWQQRGVAPSLPVVGVAPVLNGVGGADLINGAYAYGQYEKDGETIFLQGGKRFADPSLTDEQWYKWYFSHNQPGALTNNFKFTAKNMTLDEAASQYGYTYKTGTGNLTQTIQDDVVAGAQRYIYKQEGDEFDSQLGIYKAPYSYVDGSNFSSVNIADLRLAFQVQKWLERNARGGARYTEELRAHFGVSPRDERLQRPEYVGGTKSNVLLSEVVQTSSTAGTPQGNLAGKGLAADINHVTKYRATEYGLMIGIMSVMPRLTYNSQGINRQWLRQTKYDYYWPEFANLSEQAIYKSEIYATVENNNAIFSGTLDTSKYFGYQGRYDEMRTKDNMVCGKMRDTFAYWHMARDFDEEPSLNSSFVTCNPTKRIFAVQNEPGLVVHIGNRIKALRPIPIQSEPGLIDHN